MELSSSTVLVTGATNGMGFAFAAGFIADGAHRMFQRDKRTPVS